MGWKLSMILIENKNDSRDDAKLLKGLGFDAFKLIEETTLEECIYPEDKSINVGYYKNNIIICDDYHMIERSVSPQLSFYEKNLLALFPGREIIEVGCHSVVNWHTYSILKNGKKIRFKSISADDGKEESGQPVEEEKAIYAKAELKDGSYIWNGEDTEDQMMEEFTFEIIKRRLGIRLDKSEGDEWMSLKFNKYRIGEYPPDKDKQYVIKKVVQKKNTFGDRLQSALIKSIIVVAALVLLMLLLKLFS